MSSGKPTLDPLFDAGRLHSLMDAAGLDAIAAHSSRNFYYLSGFPTLDYAIEPEARCWVVLPRDPAIPATVTVPASERLTVLDVPIWPLHRIYCGRFYVHNGPDLGGTTAASTWDGLVAAIRESGLTNKRVGFELELLPVSVHAELAATFPRMQILDASPVLRRARMIKTPEEIRRLRHANQVTERAINAAVARLRPGMTEAALGRLIATGIVEQGCDVLYIQVATGAAAGLGMATERVINKGDVVRMDIAAIYQGYDSDLGRGCVVGQPSAVQRDLYRAAYGALQAGIAAVQVGAPAEAVFTASMAAWVAAGHSYVQRHHVGHSLGLQAHEYPSLRPGSLEPFAPNMVLAVEAPLYAYNVGGFAPEDVLVVGAQGNELFTRAPAELPVAGES